MIGNRIETNISGGLDVSLPAMVPVKVAFENRRVEDIAKTVAEQFKAPAIRDKIKPGAAIPIGSGSRGVANIAGTARAVVDQIKALGA